jgi:CheY-like chemotaxis protein
LGWSAAVNDEVAQGPGERHSLPELTGSLSYDARDPFSGEAPPRDDLANIKGRFLAVLNHEIRTPLSGIMGMTDLLMETSLTDEQREYVSAARACAETLFEVLNATLEYSALSGGRVELECAEFHVQDVVQAAVAEHQFRAETKGLRLYATFEEGLPETIYGDALRLRQLLSHLISNGVKFTPSGEVEVRLSTVSMSEQSARLRFQVRDTGIGIAKEQLSHIFDSFRQIDSGLARNYSGLGLGLALVEKLAGLMKGSLRAESVIGQGSSFFVECEFPRGECGGTMAASTTLAEAEPVTQAEGHILLVEDNEVAQRIYRHVLSRGNYQVDCAASGAEAMRMAHRHQYDLVLMDLQMPGVDGIEAAKGLRGISGYEETPILALTANAADEHRRLCLESGMQGFLTKPLPSEELLASVAHFLRKE